MNFPPQRTLSIRLTLTVLAVGAALPTLAAGQDVANTQSPASTPTVPLTQVIVTGSEEQYNARRDDTTTKIVVSQEEIRKFGDSTLADVLKRQPGISISGGGPGGGGEIRMRGLGSGYTQILLDGVAAPSGFSVDSLSPDLVEKIEIIRAGTADLSARAIAGTINIVLKRKIQSGKRELKLRAQHSNVFFSPAATFQVSDKLGKVAYSMDTELRYGRFKQHYEQFENADNPLGTRLWTRRAAVQNDGSFHSLSLTPRLNWTASDKDSVSWQNFIRLQRSHGDSQSRWSAQEGPLPDYPIDHIAPEESRIQLRTDLNWQRKLGAGAKLDTKFGLNASRVRGQQDEFGFDAGRVQQLERAVANDVDGYGATLTGKYSMPFGNNHQLGAGWDGSQQSTKITRDERDLYGQDTVPVFANHDYKATLQRLAVYAQDEWTMSPKLSAYVGARWETLRTSSHGNDYADIRNTSNVFSPIVQMVWKLPYDTKDQVRVALTRTYRSPDLERLLPRVTRSLNNSQVTPDSIGNPYLKPELANGIDIAFEHNGSTGAQMSVSAYARRISDYITTTTNLVDGRWRSMPGNDGDAHTKGIEFDAKFPLRLLLKDAKDSSAHMNMARNWSSLSNVPGPYNRLGGQTPFTANVGLDYAINTAFSGGANFTFKSGGPMRISLTTSTYSTVKRELDIYALWKYSPTTRIRLTAVNLLAEPATEVTRYTDAGGAMQRTSVYPFSAIVRLALETQF